MTNQSNEEYPAGKLANATINTVNKLFEGAKKAIQGTPLEPPADRERREKLKAFRLRFRAGLQKAETQRQARKLHEQPPVEVTDPITGKKSFVDASIHFGNSEDLD